MLSDMHADDGMTGKRKNPEESISLKIIGRILEVFALALLIINFFFWSMEEKDLRIIGVVLIIANILFFSGLILSHLPQELRRGKKGNAKKKIEAHACMRNLNEKRNR